MKFFIIGIICLFAVPIYSLPANPVESAFDSASVSAFRTVGRQPNAQFGERIKDWFRRVKNRILGRTEPTTPSPLDRAQELFTEVKNEDLQYAQRHPEDFYVDLSKIRFDPATDWGFRLGKWYFIRKSSEINEQQETTYRIYAKPTYPPQSTIQAKTPMSAIQHGWTSMETFATSASMENKPREITASVDVLTTTVTTPRSTSNEVLTTQTATTATPVATSPKFRDPRENETHKEKDQSAEVMGPSK